MQDQHGTKVNNSRMRYVCQKCFIEVRFSKREIFELDKRAYAICALRPSPQMMRQHLEAHALKRFALFFIERLDDPLLRAAYGCGC